MIMIIEATTVFKIKALSVASLVMIVAIQIKQNHKKTFAYNRCESSGYNDIEREYSTDEKCSSI